MEAALDAKYHANYLVSLYSWARKAKKEGHTDEANIVSEIAFAELVMHIDEQIDEDEAPVFKLGDLSQLYISCMNIAVWNRNHWEIAYHEAKTTSFHRYEDSEER